MVKITSSFIPKGSKNRPAKVNPKLYITVHNTGNTSKGSGAKNHANYLKSESAINAPISWHYTVDDVDIYQHLPEDENGYHAGDGSGDGNSKSIGIEICMNSDGDILKATDNAVELVADICKRNNLTIKAVKQHYDWTKKNCPQMIREGKPYDWKTFIDKVQKILTGDKPITIPTTGEMYRVRTAWNNSDTQQGAFTVLENAKDLADKLNSKVEYYVYDSKGNVVYPK